MQLAAHVEQQPVGLPDGGRRRVGDLRDGERLQGVDVAQPAAGLLEVGLEQEGDLAGGPGPLLPRLAQRGQPPGRPGPPGGAHGRDQRRGRGRVARDVAGVEQAERGLEVVGGHGGRLGEGPHGVVERDAGVPDRVPDGVGQRAHVAGAGVQQHQVQVAARRGLPAAQPADGDQGDPWAGVAQQSGQPAVVEPDQGLAQGGAAQVGTGQQGGALLGEGRRHRRPRLRTLPRS